VVEGCEGRRGVNQYTGKQVYKERPDFDLLYKLIHQTEQGLNGFMSYIRRQRAGAQEFGNKKIGEDEMEYDATLFEEEND
jgi:hypothetical protein